MLFPSCAVTLEYEMSDDVEALDANLRSFNRWLEEDWGFGANGRIFAVPMVSLVDAGLAVAAVVRLIGCGPLGVHNRSGPAGGRSPGDPIYDAVWARLAEAEVFVAFHACDSGYNELWSTRWGEAARPAIQDMSPFQWYLGMHGTPVADTLAALVLNGVFDRFPALTVVVVENGFNWLAQLLDTADYSGRLGRKGKPLGQHCGGKASEILRQHVYVSPFPEEDPNTLVELIGVDRVLFGSDYPHSEGLAEPVDYVEKLAGWSQVDRKKVMRDNAAHLLGVGERNF
jgi:predicted TIM-barrel fold metal-dependent hydrolase